MRLAGTDKTWGQCRLPASFTAATTKTTTRSVKSLRQGGKPRWLTEMAFLHNRLNRLMMST
ncbi:hypothetical protein BIY27_17390 [Gibbsiella quercinecans]|nr:hypothetical protein BIY27_17390 [Gibbsiella quercinecans]